MNADEELEARRAMIDVHCGGCGASFPGDMKPHTLRHAFCDHVRRVTGDVAITQALMGHKNIATTQGYMSKPTLDELAAAMGNGYPRENTPEPRTVVPVGANGPSHSVALLSDPLFCLGSRLGAANPVLQLYAEHFRKGQESALR